MPSLALAYSMAASSIEALQVIVAPRDAPIVGIESWTTAMSLVEGLFGSGNALDFQVTARRVLLENELDFPIDGRPARTRMRRPTIRLCAKARRGELSPICLDHRVAPTNGIAANNSPRRSGGRFGNLLICMLIQLKIHKAPVLNLPYSGDADVLDRRTRFRHVFSPYP